MWVERPTGIPLMVRCRVDDLAASVVAQHEPLDQGGRRDGLRSDKLGANPMLPTQVAHDLRMDEPAA